MSDLLVFTVSKADPTGKEPTVGAVLNITADLPRVKGEHPHRVWRALTVNQHVQDAQQVVAALAHLPQGTVDQILVLLLQQRASLLRISGSWPPPADAWPEPPAAFRASVGMIVRRFNVAGPEYPDTTEATALLWESLRPRSVDGVPSPTLGELVGREAAAMPPPTTQNGYSVPYIEGWHVALSQLTRRIEESEKGS